MNTFVATGFRYQDPNWAACTATSVRSMLNFISKRSVGGEGFTWVPTNSSTVRDRILAWERKHDTMAGGRRLRSARLAERAELLRLGRRGAGRRGARL